MTRKKTLADKKEDNCPDLGTPDRFSMEYHDGENQGLRFCVTNGLLWIEMGERMVSVNKESASRIKAMLDEYVVYGRICP